MERRVAALRRRLVHVVSPFMIEAEDGDVGGRAVAQRPAIQRQNPRRVLREQLDDV